MNITAAETGLSGTSLRPQLLRLQDLDIDGRRVVIRVDMNVPFADGKVIDDQRIRACLPTLELLLRQGATVIILSHLGRPQEGKPIDDFSLMPVSQRLAELLEYPVRFSQNYLDGVEMTSGEVVMCENVRFNAGEKMNDESLARQYAALGDLFVMDAFAVAHRRHASTYGAIRYADQACMGLLLEQELNVLSRVLEAPQRPIAAIVGGAKISSKLGVLDKLIEKVDCLILGGGVANVFLFAGGYKIGRSLYEPELVEAAKQLHDKAQNKGVDLILPEDVVCATAPTEEALTKIKNIKDIKDDEMILDVGPLTCLHIDQAIKNAKTILWSGPLGVFEKAAFANGTHRLAYTLTDSAAYSIAGGGDTIAAINQFDMMDGISYISTGGGAFLQFIEGETLPAIEALQEKTI